MRADLYLLEQGVFETRAQAQAAIAAGRVRIGGTVIAKPSQKVQPGAEIEAQAAHPYVGRAALKLVAGLDQFGIDPSGRTCLDVGSSTGGFTEVLLERGRYAIVRRRQSLDELLACEQPANTWEAP